MPGENEHESIFSDMQPLEGLFKETDKNAYPHLLPSPQTFERAKLIPSGKPITFGATPLGYRETAASQRELLGQLQEMVYCDVPLEISEDISTFVKNTFESRFTSRGLANHENYESSLRKKEDFSHSNFIQEMISRAEMGYASPVELLAIRRLLGIRSVELACLTHPYGKRMGQLEVMREATRKSVELLDGKYYDQPETRFKVKGVVRRGVTSSAGNGDGAVVGVLMTRKRTLGAMPDGTIIRERTSFVLRFDAPDIVSDEQFEAIRGVEVGSDGWADKILEAGNLAEVANQLMNDDECTLAVPISSTIYAFNLETTREIELKKAEDRERIREEERQRLERYPALRAALQATRAVGLDEFED